MGVRGTLLTVLILLCTLLEPAFSEPRCSLVPYGRPYPSHCVYISNHLLPYSDAPQGFVLYGPPEPHIRLPLIYFYCQSSSGPVQGRSLISRTDTCIIYMMPAHLPPLDPRHVWSLSMNGLRDQIDEIVYHCLVHGETGWAPQMGGTSMIANGKGAPRMFASASLASIRMPTILRQVQRASSNRNVWHLQLSGFL